MIVQNVDYPATCVTHLDIYNTIKRDKSARVRKKNYIKFQKFLKSVNSLRKSPAEMDFVETNNAINDNNYKIR